MNRSKIVYAHYLNFIPSGKMFKDGGHGIHTYNRFWRERQKRKKEKKKKKKKRNAGGLEIRGFRVIKMLWKIFLTSKI